MVASPVTVNVLLTVPPAIVKPMGCDVGVNPFTLVTVATPKIGVIKVGVVAKTKLPVPVWLVVVRGVPPPKAIEVPVAAPNTGVTKVGVLANTAPPVPVSSVNVVANSPELTLPVLVPYKVPLVGKVTFVAAVEVNVTSFAGVVVKAPPVKIFPPIVMVFIPLFIPVPPYCPLKTLPCQVPVPIVPKLVIFPCTAVGSVELIEGTPNPLVINTPSFDVANPVIVLLADEYNS